MTVAASFNMPSPVSKYLQERFGMSEQTADVTAQVCLAAIKGHLKLLTELSCWWTSAVTNAVQSEHQSALRRMA